MTVSPQKENGYVPIANELFDALVRYRIPGEQRQCLDYIIRRTYGYNQKQAMIKLKHFVENTGIKKPNVIRALAELLSKKIIIVIKKDNVIAHIYEFNKNYERWQPLSKKITRYQKREQSLSKKIILPIKDNIKDISVDDIPKKTDDTVVGLYEYYLKTIQPENKSRARAIKNLIFHRKSYPHGQLKASIDNYHPTSKKRESQYRKDPANFFGRQDPAFIDYLPDNFIPTEPEQDYPMYEEYK